MPLLILTPNNITFNHKKYSSLPAAIRIDYANLQGDGFSIEIEDLPEWLSRASSPIQDFLEFRPNDNANDLAAGTYSASVKIIDTVEGNFISSGFLQVTLNLEDTVLLNVWPSSGSYVFTIGGSEPIAKTFSITSENAWTITKNADWLTLSTSSGSNTGSFLATVTATGKAAGTYNDVITVDDGVDTFQIPISLTVSNPDTGVDFLYVYPNELNFGFTASGITPPSKSIDLNASATFAAVASEAWIDLAASSGPAGASSFAITMQNLSGLSEGFHVGYVDISVGSIVKRVVIELTVYEYVTEMLDPAQLYFSDDMNLIKVSSGRTDTHLQMLVTSNYYSSFFNLIYNVPFFKGVAEKRIGAEARTIIGDQLPINIDVIYGLTPYQPVALDFLINEVDLYTEQVVQSVALSNIKFLQGQKPASNLLSNLPETIFLTAQGLLVFSVLSGGLPLGTISISGDATAEVVSTTPTADFYTVVVALSQLANLAAGDQLTISALDQALQVVVIDQQIDHAIVLYQTQWGTFEAFECVGEITKTIKPKQSKYISRINHLQKQTNVLTSEIVTSYKLNTGYIMTEEIAEFLQHLVASKVITLVIDGEKIAVRSTTSSLKIAQSLRQGTNFNLNFEKIIIE